MTGHEEHSFDKDYWENQWNHGEGEAAMTASPPNPYLSVETADLTPGTALDAGCGAGAEAIWLAEAGWQVTAADISTEALSRAAQRAKEAGADHVEWVEADLSTWQPAAPFDLVMTHYAHPSMPQLDFYDRIATWVAPSGTLLIVGHLHTHHGTHGHSQPPTEASVTADAITARLDDADWTIVTAQETQRTLTMPDGQQRHLDDVVVRATRRTV